MKLLFIGGTGIISSACSDLAVARGHELFVLNRSMSKKYPIPQGAIVLQADVNRDEVRLATLLAGHRFDAVVDYLAYTTSVSSAARQINSFLLVLLPPIKSRQRIMSSPNGRRLRIRTGNIRVTRLPVKTGYCSLTWKKVFPLRLFDPLTPMGCHKSHLVSQAGSIPGQSLTA